jgi:hypothetical protein
MRPKNGINMDPQIFKGFEELLEEYYNSHYFMIIHIVQTGSGAHPASYPMCTRGSSPGSKTARV